MALTQRRRFGILLSLLLLSTAAQAQPVPYDPTQVPSPIPNPFMTQVPLRSAWDLNRGVLRSECVWRRATWHGPYDTEVERAVNKERLRLENSALSPEQRKAHLQLVRQMAERDAKGYTTTSEFRLQWDGERTRCETRAADADGWMPDVDYYDRELALFVDGVRKSAPHDFATVQRPVKYRNWHVDSIEGMAALLKGVPLTVALQNAEFTSVVSDTSGSHVLIRRRIPISTTVGWIEQPDTVDRGDVRLTIDTDTGRIAQIAELRTGDDSINTSIVPSDYRTYQDAFHLPRRLVVTRYGNGSVLTKEEYTLLSAKFNDELDLRFLQGPIFSRRTQVTDIRTGIPGLVYFTADRPLSPDKLGLLQLRDQTRRYLPFALMLQIPLITAILLRRRNKARQKPSLRKP